MTYYLTALFFISFGGLAICDAVASLVRRIAPPSTIAIVIVTAVEFVRVAIVASQFVVSVRAIVYTVALAVDIVTVCLVVARVSARCAITYRNKGDECSGKKVYSVKYSQLRPIRTLKGPEKTIRITRSRDWPELTVVLVNWNNELRR